MKLDNNIVRKLLEDPTGFILDTIESLKGGQVVEGDIEGDKYADIIHVLSAKGNKNYYITKSVQDKLELLDVKKCMELEGWKLFKDLPDTKKT